MNNVWTSIALRAPFTTRCSRSKPILELFNGYSRRHQSRWMHPNSREPRIYDNHRWKSAARCTRQPFSTSAALSLRQRKPPPPRKYRSQEEIEQQYKNAYLSEPPRSASHTEGLDPAEEEEELTWRDYDPVGGMPLPDGELSQGEMGLVFGTEKLDADTGNYILSVLHWRRLSGALIDQELSFPRNSGVTRQLAMKALQYLRQQMPEVDEEANGQRWAEEEGERLQQEMKDRAVELRLYKPEETDVPGEESQPQQLESEQGTAEGRQRNEESVLQSHVRQKEVEQRAKEIEEKAAQEKAELATLHSRRGPLELSGGVQPDTQMILYGPGGISITAPQTKAWLQPVERKPWVKYYEERAQIIRDHTIPQLSLFRRLVPSFLVLLAALWFANFLSENYTPPPTNSRIWPDYPPSVATLIALTATLAFFFIANRFPPLWRTYSKYFTIVPAYPYAASVIGATFRHDTPSHLATNTAALWLMGLLLHEDVGRGTFLAIFLASGAIGGFTSLAYLVLRKNWYAYVFGCSGAVLGVASALCTLRPQGKITVAGYELPIAAWMFLALWGGLELVAAWKVPRMNVDHAGHIGGLIGGVACAMWLRMKARRAGEGKVVTNGQSDVQMVRIEGS